MSLYVRERGDPNHPTIVFIHGGNVSGWMWDLQVKMLQHDYHCLVPDLPEHGQSIHITPFSIQDSAQRIVSLIRDHSNHGAAHIVGLSLGGAIALQTLSIAPDVVDRMVISAATLGPIPGAGIITRLARPIAWLTRQPFAYRRSAKSLAIPEAFMSQFEADAQRLASDTFRRINQEANNFRLPDNLHDIKTPVLVGAGENELKLVHRKTKQILSVLPNATGYIAPDVGHGWNGEKPELFTQMIRAWIEEKPLPEELLPLDPTH